MSQLNINKSTYNIYKYAAFLSIAVIFLLGVAFLQPFSFTENTNATTERTTNGDYYIETTTTDLNLTINTTPAGTQETASHDVTVKTDDPAGYTLTVSVNNDTSNALNLNGNTSATEKFSATSGTYNAPKALDENSWGFADTLTKKNNDQWAAVPLLSNAQQIKQTSSASTSGDTTTVHYAISAKYDGQHSNGNYSNTIVYSVTGNTIPKKDLSSITYMQDATYDMCKESTDYDPTSTATQKATTYELYDKRTDFDNEYPYYIRKLADGNCWMVENLYLEGGKTLTKSDTNITADTYNLPTSSTSGFSSDTAANLFSGGRNRDGYKQGNYAADGSYMTWVLAKAGTASGKNSDVCPKNWRLPENSEYGTVVGWGYSTFDTRWFADKDGGNNSATPIYPGYYLNSALRNNGSVVYWWSSTQRNADGGYFLGRSGTYLSTSGNYKRLGYSVRCMLSRS